MFLHAPPCRLLDTFAPEQLFEEHLDNSAATCGVIAVRSTGLLIVFSVWTACNVRARPQLTDAFGAAAFAALSLHMQILLLKEASLATIGQKGRASA